MHTTFRVLFHICFIIFQDFKWVNSVFDNDQTQNCLFLSFKTPSFTIFKNTSLIILTSWDHLFYSVPRASCSLWYIWWLCLRWSLKLVSFLKNLSQWLHCTGAEFPCWFFLCLVIVFLWINLKQISHWTLLGSKKINLLFDNYQRMTNSF